MHIVHHKIKNMVEKKSFLILAIGVGIIGIIIGGIIIWNSTNNIFNP